MKKALSLLLALMMVVGLVMPQTWATGLQETEPDAAITETQPGDTAEPDAQLPQADTMSGNSAGLTPITRTKNAVASGVTLEKVVMRNVNGSQVVGYLSEIDLSKDVTLKASYTGYYYDGSTAAQRKAMVDGGKLKWEMSQTTAQPLPTDGPRIPRAAWSWPPTPTTTTCRPARLPATSLWRATW